MLSSFFKSVIEQDTAPVVICDTEHKIIYMNPAAISRYQKWGGASLVGKSLLDCHNQKSREMIHRVLDWFKKSPQNNTVHTFFNEKEGKDVYIVALRDSEAALIGYYEKHEWRNRDTSPFYSLT